MPFVPLKGSARAPLPRAQLIGRPAPLRLIDVTVVLKPRTSVDAMSSSLEEMARRPPRERRYLSREELLRAYGADPADIAKVRRFARQHGLAVVAQDLAARTVELRGTVAALSRAFNVQLFLYRHPRGIYRGRVGVIHVPAELENIVQAVIGLDNRPQTRTHFRTITDRGGAWFNAAGVSYSPTQVGQLYDFPTDVNGQGQCIAIIELGGGYTMNDLNIYFQQLGLNTPNVSSVSVLGGMNSPTGNPSGPDGEVMLDIEVAGAVAQGAKIVVYFTPNTDRGFLRAINRAINDRVNNPSVISISWGGPESSWTLQSMQAFNQAFQAAAQLGITVCVAAGDGGSSDGVPGSIAHVDFPASSPYVLACGGTQLVGSGTTIATEIVWDDGATGGATGGGVSNVFQLPSWQSNANVPPSVNPNHHVGRGVPDVAGDADPITGYKVRVDGGDHIFGGTSAVAPLWAGLISLINQKLGVRVGYLNPTLYSLSSSTEAFHDITKGDNDNTGAVGGYNAAIGWDACTGLGSPDGQQLTNALGG